MVATASALDAFLRRNSFFGVDTAPFIYHVEANPVYTHLTEPLFMWLEHQQGTAVTSTLTMTELLVRPYREGNLARVNALYALASTLTNVQWQESSLAIADLAAQLRALYRLRTPDAVQAATALEARATGFVTNDAAFRRVAELDVFLFDE